MTTWTDIQSVKPACSLVNCTGTSTVSGLFIKPLFCHYQYIIKLNMIQHITGIIDLKLSDWLVFWIKLFCNPFWKSFITMKNYIDKLLIYILYNTERVSQVSLPCFFFFFWTIVDVFINIILLGSQMHKNVLMDKNFMVFFLYRRWLNLCTKGFIYSLN